MTWIYIPHVIRTYISSPHYITLLYYYPLLTTTLKETLYIKNTDVKVPPINLTPDKTLLVWSCEIASINRCIYGYFVYGSGFNYCVINFWTLLMSVYPMLKTGGNCYCTYLYCKYINWAFILYHYFLTV